MGHLNAARVIWMFFCFVFFAWMILFRFQIRLIKKRMKICMFRGHFKFFFFSFWFSQRSRIKSFTGGGKNYGVIEHKPRLTVHGSNHHLTKTT